VSCRFHSQVHDAADKLSEAWIWVSPHEGISDGEEVKAH
jgi:hypothetical protein